MTSITPQSDSTYWIGLSCIRKIGPATWHRLLARFATAQEIWEANAADLVSAGISEQIAQEIIIERSAINLDTELEKLLASDCAIVTIKDPHYPELLKQIYQPPAMLYYRGSLDCLRQRALAVVGTRKYSAYGKQVTGELVGQIAQHNITIISGLALGIDALAHQATLAVSGLTAGVLGSGIDTASIYPSVNRFLAQQIIDQGGVILSEYPIGALPTKFSFPLRNRIIAGLASGTLVVEAAESSGSLITARYALEFNRDVFAVPGSIYNLQSVGTNNLIKAGAKMVNGVNDILEDIDLDQLDSIDTHEPLDLAEDEQNVYNSLTKEPQHIDIIARTCNIKSSVLSGLLMVLEMKGVIKDMGGKHYVRAK